MDYVVAPVSCGALTAVTYASNTTTGTDYDDTITYTCLSGYEKTSGNIGRTCQADEHWSGSPPVCCKYNLILHCYLMGVQATYQHYLFNNKHDDS